MKRNVRAFLVFLIFDGLVLSHSIPNWTLAQTKPNWANEGAYLEYGFYFWEWCPVDQVSSKIEEIKHLWAAGSQVRHVLVESDDAKGVFEYVYLFTGENTSLGFWDFYWEDASWETGKPYPLPIYYPSDKLEDAHLVEIETVLGTHNAYEVRLTEYDVWYFHEDTGILLLSLCLSPIMPHNGVDSQDIIVYQLTSTNAFECAPDFVLSCSPYSQTINLGESVAYTVRVASTNGFTSAVALSLSGLPDYTFDPNPVTLPADGSVESILEIDTAATIPGTYSLAITGSSEGRDHSMDVTLIVQGPLPVPYHGQGTTSWCGPASLTMILRYYGENVHIWDVADDLEIDRDSSVWFPILQTYLETHYPNLDCEHKGPYANLDNMLRDILTSIDSKHLSMLMIPMMPTKVPTSHMVVVVGYSGEGTDNTLFINDPSGYLFGLLERKVDEKYGQFKHDPIMAPVAWRDLRDLLFGPEILIVKGSRKPLQSTLYIEDRLSGVVSHHSEREGESRVGVYVIFGRNGIIWYAEEGHGLQLDSNDALMIITHVANHLQSLEPYRITVTMEEEKKTIPLIEIQENVEKCTIWKSYSFLQLSDYVKESGDYQIRLRLANGNELYDEFSLPTIHYEYLNKEAVRSLLFNGDVGSKQYATFNYRILASLPDITFTLSWGGSDLDLHVFDSEGRHVGMNYTTGKVELQILGSAYASETNSERISISNPTPELYQIGIYGRQLDQEKEPFSITILKGISEQPWYQEYWYVIAVAVVIIAIGFFMARKYRLIP